MNIIKRKENAGNVEKAVDAFNASFGEGVELEEASDSYVVLDVDSNGEIAVLENLQEDVEQDRIIGDDYDFVVDHYDKYGGMFAYEGTVGPYTLGQEYEAVDHDGTMVAAGIHVYPNGKATLLFNGKDNYGVHFNETYEFRVDKETDGLSESLEEDPASETQKPFKVDMTLDRDENEAVEAEVYAEDKKEATEKAEKLYDSQGYDIKDVEEVERHPVGDVEGAEKVLDESMLTEDEEEIVVSSEPEEVNIIDLKKADNIFLALDELPIGSSIKGVYRVADDSGEEVAIEKVADDVESAGYFWSFDGYPNRAIEDTIISILNNENSTYMCYDFSEYFDEALNGDYVPELSKSSEENKKLIYNAILYFEDLWERVVEDLEPLGYTFEPDYFEEWEDSPGTIERNGDFVWFNDRVEFKFNSSKKRLNVFVLDVYADSKKQSSKAIAEVVAQKIKELGYDADVSYFGNFRGKARLDVYVNIPESVMLESLKESLDQTEEDTGIAAIISDVINKEYEVVNIADALSHQVENSDVLDILEDITSGAHGSIGKLQSCLELFSPTADAIEDGAEEAEQVLSESLNESILNKLNSPKLVLNEDRYDDWLAHDDRYDDDITDEYDCLENNLRIPYLSKKPLFLYASENGDYILSDDDIYYTEDYPSELETFSDLDDAYDYIEVVSKLKEHAEFEYKTDFSSEQDAVNWALSNDDDNYVQYEVRKQHDGKYTIYTWTEGDLLTEGMSYKGYVISVTQSGTNVIKDGKVIREFATEDEAREFIDDNEKNESLTILEEAAQTYTVNFLDEDENIIDTFSLKNLNTVRKRINARMADEEALYNDGITSIEVDNENGDSIFLALQDAPEFDDDGNIVSYGVWSIEQDDIDAAKEAELDEIEQASVFNSVYSDLVAASDPAEIKLRRIKGRAPRYDYSEVGVDFDGNITISSEDTSFARKVADEYGLSIVETRNGVKLIIPEE